MAGGAGDDRYVVDSLDDRVIELDGGGIDTVHAVVDWTLGDHVEHLSLVGGRAFRGTGNDLDNHLVGNADANELLGGAGNDSLDGGTGPRFDLGVRVDRLVGGTGDDTYLVRGVYDEVVEQAGEGIDRVVAFIDWTLGGHVEHLTLAADGNGWSATGNALDNTIFGNALANQIDGAAGDDLLQGGGGADRYRFSAGWGRDRIVDAVAAGSAASGTAADDGAVDSIAFDATVAAGDLVLGRSGSDLVIERRGAADRIVAVDFFGNDTSTGRVERIEFADGQAWTRADVERRMPVVTPPPATQPGAGDPTATGPVGATPPAANPAPDPSSPSSPSSPAGNTVLPSAGPVPPAATTPGGAFAQPSGSTPAGGASPQRHTGGTAADQLFGGSGDDWLAGGHGNDRLAGGTGSDTYVFGRGNGVDTIVESGGASAGHDVLQFGEGIRADQIWFSRSGQDLEIRLVGSADRTTVSGWYDGSGPRIEEFRTASGARLLESQVQQLVEAMAAFAPPAPGQTTLPLPHQMHLLPVLAANWS
jgi:Ca2+-binding RTX toxin-like protein